MQGPKRRKLHERAVKQLSGPDQRLVCALSVGDAMCSLEARAGNRGAFQQSEEGSVPLRDSCCEHQVEKKQTSSSEEEEEASNDPRLNSLGTKAKEPFIQVSYVKERKQKQGTVTHQGGNRSFQQKQAAWRTRI